MESLLVEPLSNVSDDVLTVTVTNSSPVCDDSLKSTDVLNVTPSELVDSSYLAEVAVMPSVE